MFCLSFRKKGEISDALTQKIMLQKELSVLQKWLKLAVKADTVENVEKEM